MCVCVCVHLSSVCVHFLPQQYLKAMVLMQQVKDVRHLIIPADTCQQTHLHAHTHTHTHTYTHARTSKCLRQMTESPQAGGSVGGAYQQVVVLSRGQVGVAQVTGGLQHSDYALHVTGETEAVVSDNQQLDNYRREEGRSFYLLVHNNKNNSNVIMSDIFMMPPSFVFNKHEAYN